MPPLALQQPPPEHEFDLHRPPARVCGEVRQHPVLPHLERHPATEELTLA